MAEKISTDGTIYFVDFENGNDAGDIDSYSAYPNDMDTNFTSIRNKFNALVDEVIALGGSGVMLNFDLTHINDAASPGGAHTQGVVGEHSYKAVINGGDASLLDIAAGSALIPGNTRVELTGAVQLDGDTSPAAETKFIALDVNGAVSIQTSGAQKQMDLYQVTWSGSAWTGTPAREAAAPILFDGDAYRILRQRTAIGSCWSAKAYDLAAGRVAAIERILCGLLTDEDGDSIGPLELNADWLATGLVDHERGGLEFDASAVIDADFIVGTGTGTFGIESGNTARTSLGLGTGDSPTFTGVDAGAMESGASTLGFYGITPIVQSAAFLPTNVTPDRAYDADTVVITELADIVGTLISDLQAVGLLQ